MDYLDIFPKIKSVLYKKEGFSIPKASKEFFPHHFYGFNKAFARRPFGLAGAKAIASDRR